MQILITGGNGGLGSELTKAFRFEEHEVITMGKGCEVDVDFRCCLDVESVLHAEFGDESVDGIIHCAGTNYITPHDDLDWRTIKSVFSINALSNFIINRHFLSKWMRSLPRFICHVISDAAWTPMTHSLAYNVSKAAQLMVMRQMAHEHKPLPVIFGVSPGKIAGTGMSNYIDKTFPALRGMTIEEGRAYQASRLRTGEMSASYVAEFIKSLIDTRSVHMHGHNFIIGG